MEKGLSVGMLSPVLVEHVGGDVEDDVLRMDVAGFALCSKAGTAGSECLDREIRKVLAKQL